MRDYGHLDSYTAVLPLKQTTAGFWLASFGWPLGTPSVENHPLPALGAFEPQPCLNTTLA